MSRALAINVAANTTLPGFRGPIYPDGSFEYVPIPEREPTREAVPTYGDLSLSTPIPTEQRDRRVHLDPEFAGCQDRPAYTYGDEHGVKAGPIADLSAGDRLLFYATLEPVEPSDRYPWWVAPDWGAYVIGEFVLETDPVTGAEYRDLSAAERERFASNAHVKREEFDAKVLVRGDPERSRLLECAVPLSTPDAGAEANPVVTDLSNDSGRGPWWRRPLRFDEAAMARLVELLEDPAAVPARRSDDD